MTKSALYTLIAMQLREKYKINFRTNLKKSLFSLAFSVILFAVVTVIIYFLLFLVSYLRILSMVSMIPVSALNIALAAILTLSAVTSTVGLVKSLYLSRDNIILLTFPVKPNVVFLSKLLVFFVAELRKNIYLIVPLLLAYGIFNSAPAVFFLMIIPSYLLLSLISVAVGTLLSVPGLFIALLLRNVQYIQTILIVLAGSAAVALIFWIASSIPENLDIAGSAGDYYYKILDFIEAFNNAAPFFALITEMVAGKYTSILNRNPYTANTFIIMACVIAMLAVIFVSAFFLQSRLFIYMASKPNEHKKNFNPTKPNRRIHPLFSEFKKEVIIILRSPSVFFANYMSVIMLPFAIFLLNKIFASMSTRILGDQMSLAFNLLIILLITLCSNIPLSYALSKEGGTAYQFKTNPVKITDIIISKLAINTVLTVISLVFTAAIMTSVGKFPGWTGAFVFFIALSANIAHVLMCIESDITRPQYKKYYNGVHLGVNPNEAACTAAAFLAAFALAGLTMFFFMQENNGAWIRVLLIALAFLAARVYLIIARTKVYYREF